MTLEGSFLEAAARAASAVDHVTAAAPARPPGTGGADTDIKSLDEAAERAAIEALAPLGLPIISEECGIVEDRPCDGEPWIALDPIDGTRNCLHGYPPWSIAIGLVRAGVPLAGYVVDLSCGQRWWSGDGPGAFCDGKRVRTRRGGIVVLPSTDPADLRPLEVGPLYPRGEGDQREIRHPTAPR